ncbi:hypothetical protein EPI10_022977 [Gossypium australe]|uniref:Uncharacterized protein n=1 Tax=Gossypium australe TaxID=47621 RepID=A0A5B6VTH9_9ROSI|nr:hypothetical protein EPI10_022977 [Gossypium australe]
MVEKKALLSKVLLAKYGISMQQWRSSANNLKEMSTVWRGIVENSFDVSASAVEEAVAEAGWPECLAGVCCARRAWEKL